MEEPYVLHTVENRVHYLTLNRSEKRNPLGPGMVAALKSAIAEAEKDTDCKVAVICGNSTAFCAGADLEHLRQIQNNSFEENREDSVSLGELFTMIRKSRLVFIAMVEGPALAGGCGLATICDLSYATAESTFGYTEVRIGFVPALVMIFLVPKVGEAIARELFLTGRIIPASEALDKRLINGIFPADLIRNDVRSIAENITRNASAHSLKLVKEMFQETGNMGFDEAIGYACSVNARARASEDCQKGIAAFLNKEKISW